MPPPVPVTTVFPVTGEVEPVLELELELDPPPQAAVPSNKAKAISARAVLHLRSAVLKAMSNMPASRTARLVGSAKPVHPPGPLLKNDGISWLELLVIVRVVCVVPFATKES